MRKTRFGILLLILTLVMSSTQLAAAAGSGKDEESKELIVYNSRLITNDKDATFIEGEVPVANGQTIALKTGLLTISEKKMPDTKTRAKFKIKVPGKNISDNGQTVLFVVDKDNREFGRARVELEYKERQDQEIKAESKDFSLTFPSEDVAIKAEATSGEKLIYSSSDPDVCDVDEFGNIITKGSGKAQITVKQIGNSAYKEAEEKLKVSVTDIDAYTVTFHSSDDANSTYRQVINVGEDVNLKDNAFQNGEHEFLGWATSDEDLMKYLDAEDVKDLAAKGENVDLYAVWSGDGVRGAIAWAEKIAADDSFSYGKKPQTSRLGCYFCGTNQKKKPKGYEKTYVCMTFITAAYAHGAEDPELYRDCSSGKHCITETNSNLSRYKCFKKVGLCKNLSVSDLEPGDVIINYAANNYSGHVSMYIGDGDIVDAEGIRDCWGPNSIAIRHNKAGNFLRGAAKHNGSSYVMRYTGPRS